MGVVKGFVSLLADGVLLCALAAVWSYFHSTALWSTGLARPNDGWSRYQSDSEAARLLSLRELDLAAAQTALRLTLPGADGRPGTGPSAATVLTASNQVTNFRFDHRRTGLAPMHTTVGRQSGSDAVDGTSGKGNYELVWKTTPLNAREYYASKSSPSVSTRHVYIGTDRGTLVALDRYTGKQHWEFVTTAPTRNPKGIHGTASFDPLADRTRDLPLVYIGDYSGWLYAVNRVNGSQYWRSKLGGSLGSSPVVYEGLVLIGVELNLPNRPNGDGFLHISDSRRGSKLWRSPFIGGHPHATPTIDPVTHTAFLGGNAGVISAWDLSPLLCNRTTGRGATLMSRHALESACVLSRNKTQPSDIRTVWSFQTGKHPVDPARDGWAAHWVAPSAYPDGEIKSTAALHPRADILYVSAWDFVVYALDSRTGAELWWFRARDRLMSSPAIDPVRELVVVGSHDRNVYGLDARTGARRWTVVTGERVLSSATIVLADGVALIGGGDGFVYVIDLDTGAVSTRLAIDDMVTSAPVAVGRELFVNDFAGSVYCYRAIGGGVGVTGTHDLAALEDAYGPALDDDERRRMGGESVDDRNDDRPEEDDEDEDDEEEEDE